MPTPCDPMPPEDNETPGMQSGPHWERQNGLPASSVSAWCGVAGDGGRVGGEFLGSARGLWVVSCGQFGFHGEAAHLPRKRGCSVRRNAPFVPHMHHTVLLLRPGRPAGATPTGPFRRWGSGCMPFPGDCIPEARNGRGVKETAFKPPVKQPGLAGCICSKSVPMARGWQGQVAVSQVRHAVSPPHRHARPGPQAQAPNPTPPSTSTSTPARALPGTAPARGPRANRKTHNRVERLPSACHCPP
jgi:hypothetical protein